MGDLITAEQNNNTKVSKMFFSLSNKKKIQLLIKKKVSEKTYKKFSLDIDQDEQDLLVAMMKIYKEFAINRPDKIKEQIKALNKKLIDYIIPDIITGIKQHYSYLKEINEPIKLLPRPVNVNNSGRKLFPSITTTWLA